jgi:hypothetical protein
MARSRAWRRVVLSIAAPVALVPMLFQPIPAAASATGTLFGIVLNTLSVSSIDPASGATTKIADLSLPGQRFPGFSISMADDATAHRLYLLRIVTDMTLPPPNNSTVQLVTVDTAHPGTPPTYTVPIQPLAGLALDTSSGTLFGITPTNCCPNSLSVSIVKVDPSTGSETSPIPVTGDSFGLMAIDPATHLLYVTSLTFPTTTLLTVNTVAGVVVGSTVLPLGLRGLVFDPSQAALFGTSFCCPAHFVKIDVATLTETILGSYDFGMFLEPALAIDTASPSHTVFTVQDVSDPSNPQFGPVAHIASINAQTGAGMLGGSTGTNIAALAFEPPGIAPPDTSPPVTSVALSPAPNAAGLNNTNVTVTISATDPDGVADVASIHYSATGAQPIAPTVLAGSSASFTVTADGVTTVTYFAVDQAGNSEAPHTLELRIDKTPPVTSIALTPAPNGAGWNNTNVTVNLSATDPDGVADVAAVHYSAAGAQPVGATFVAGSSASLVVTAEGVTTVTYFASDKAGNTEPPHTQVIRIDKTLPTITYAGNAGLYTVDQTVSITCTALDPANANGTPGSGLASSTCANVNAPAYTFPLGLNSLSASATDIAGNVGSGSTTFTVQVTYSSLCRLTARFIESSPAFQTLPALGQAQEDRLCTRLVTAGVVPDPAKKALVESYQKGLTLLVNMGFLTPAQAAILLTLSQAL